MAFDAAAYQQFLDEKVQFGTNLGFDIQENVLHPWLKPHAAALVHWALRKGRAAIFASFGLHKTSIQLEVAAVITGQVWSAETLSRAASGKRFLIVAPLGVRQEFRRDAESLGLTITFIKSSAEIAGPGIYVTNYESVRAEKLNMTLFEGVSLDEAAVLRAFGGTATFRALMNQFEGTRYRFVATATPSPNEYIELLAYAAFLGVMDVGQAKAQPIDAKILTPTGWELMGNIAPGDMVIAQDGSPTPVLGVYPQGERDIYRVSFSDGASAECDAEHLWLTTTSNERQNEQRYRKRNGTGNDGSRNGDFATVKTTAEITKTLVGTNGTNHVVPVVAPVQFAPRNLPLHPWALGALIGDGCLRTTSITFSTADEWMLGNLAELLPPGLGFRETAPGSADYTISTTPGRQGGSGWGANKLLVALREMGLLGKRAWEKSIPEDYLFSTVEDRLALLRGLMDTDGTIGIDKQTIFCTVSRELAYQVVELVRSLGGIATTRLGTPCKFTRHQAYLVEIRLEENPFSLPRKAVRHRERGIRCFSRYITGVEFVGRKQAQCIAIEHPDKLYVTDDFIVTHNTRFFKRDSANADKLTLHAHKEREFWLWVSSWAIFMLLPSDLGFDDTGYVMPELEVHWHEVPSDHTKAGQERDGQGRMFRSAAIGVSDAATEKRDSMTARIAKLQEIRALEPDEHRIIWHDLEDERRAIEKAVPGVVSVYGSQKIPDREATIIAFSNGEIKEVAAKPQMLGAGVNLQRHCARAIFLGITFKAYQVIQAIHRLQRFGQGRVVRVDFIYTEAERDVKRILEQKWKRHIELVERMRQIVKEFGLAEIAFASVLNRSMGVERQEASGAGWSIVNHDSVVECARAPANSVDLIVTSIPFATQYEYTPTFNDFGHTDDNVHFWRQMDFLTPSLFNMLAPGRDACIHVKDRIVPGGVNGLGFQTLHPFHAEAIYHYQRHGFAFLGMKTITTDVVRENNQTYRLGWTEQCKDGSRMGCGVPEYVLLFRKPPSDLSSGYADKPIVKDKPLAIANDGTAQPWDKRNNWKRPVPGTGYSRSAWQLDAHGYMRSSGERLLSAQELAHADHADLYKWWEKRSLGNVYDYAEHKLVCEQMDALQRLPATFMLWPPHSVHPDVWTDITRMLSLNSAQSAAGRETHLCPLQFDIVDRLITQLSMPGEVVFDPFAGIGTVPLRALKLGRIGKGCELSATYWRDGVRYCEAQEREASMVTLFDLMAIGEQPPVPPVPPVISPEERARQDALYDAMGPDDDQEDYEAEPITAGIFGDEP